MFELFLSKTPNKEASPAVARKPRHPAKKFSSQFLICARRFFSSKRKRKLLCGVLLLTSRTAGLSAFCIRSGVAEFPPNPPSATPSRGRFFFRRNLRLYFAKQNAPPKEMLPLTHPTHSRATPRNSLKIHLQNCLN